MDREVSHNKEKKKNACTVFTGEKTRELPSPGADGDL